MTGSADTVDEFHIDLATGRIREARWQPSPNCDDRPAGCAIDLVVIHGISLPAGDFGGPYIDALFCNCLDPAAHPSFAGIAPLRVSAHLLIRRDGALVQYVPLQRRAWHAGASCFENRTACNDFSIGIELEGSDDTPYTDAQYAALRRLLPVLMRAYPAITPARITGHSDIAPGRKTDPGPLFDWARLRAALTDGPKAGH